MATLTSLTPAQRAERARIASKARWANTTSEQRSAHGHAIRTNLDAYVRAVVDRAPELTGEQIERLRALLPPVDALPPLTEAQRAKLAALLTEGRLT